MNIQDYIKGSKHGKEAKEFEKNLMRDPFLSEAMEGYESVKGNHDLIINRLRKNIEKKANRKKFRFPMFIWSSIVAAVAVIAIVVIFFLGGFHRYLGNKNQLPVADSVKGSSLPVVDSLQNKDSVKENEIDRDSAITEIRTSSVLQTQTAKKNKEKKLATVVSRSSASAKLLPKEKTHVVANRKEPIPDTVNYSIGYAASLNKQTPPEFIQVNGVVKDDKGAPMIGVKIATGNSPAVFSDSQGKFSLKSVLNGQKVIFSYIGFKTNEVLVDAKSGKTLSVTMKENDDSLENQEIISRDQWKNSKQPKPEDRKAVPSIGWKAYQVYVEGYKKQSSDKDCSEKSGKIKVAFSTDKKGRPYNIRVVQGLCPEYDRQSVCLINDGAAWTADCQLVEYEIKF